MEKLKEKINKYKRRMKASLRFISKHPLTKENKLSAYYRYLRFHLVQLVNHKKPMKYNFIDDIKFYASMGEAGIVGNIYVGLADFEEMAFLLHFLNSEDLFVDIGANVGAYTLLGSGICNSKTIAIEPIPSTFKRLEKNIELNNLSDDKVDIVNIGIGKEKGYIHFLNSQYSALNRVITDKDPDSLPKIQVMTLPLDGLLMDYKKPSMIKIDVEGFEFEVIKGASNCLQCKDLKAIIIELNQSGKVYGHNDEEIANLLYEEGFSPYRYEPFSRSLITISGKNNLGFNTIFIRDIDAVYARLRAAPKRKILSSFI